MNPPPEAPRPVPWEWPASLDALTAAPHHHALIFENQRVRVLETRILPGDATPIHTHRWPSVLHVLSWSDCVRRDAAGRLLLDTRTGPGAARPASVAWSDPLPPHSLENVGPTEIRILSVELKDIAG